MKFIDRPGQLTVPLVTIDDIASEKTLILTFTIEASPILHARFQERLREGRQVINLREQLVLLHQFIV